MQGLVWDQKRERAREILPDVPAEIIDKIQKPFVTAISDTRVPRATFYDNKLLIVGDAMTLSRPHTGRATAEAAYHVLLLEDVWNGERTSKNGTSWSDSQAT